MGDLSRFAIEDLTPDQIHHLLELTDHMTEVSSRPIPKVPALRGKTVVNLFFEDSTRTRISFELAAKRLSADVINFSAKGSSVSKGESLKDTALTLEAMGADAVVIRHHADADDVVTGSEGTELCVCNRHSNWKSYQRSRHDRTSALDRRQCIQPPCGPPTRAWRR